MKTDELISKLQTLLSEKARALECEKSEISDISPPPKARDEPEKESENPELDPGLRPPVLEGLSLGEIVLMLNDGVFDERPDILEWINRRTLPGQLMPRWKI